MKRFVVATFTVLLLINTLFLPQVIASEYNYVTTIDVKWKFEGKMVFAGNDFIFFRQGWDIHRARVSTRSEERFLDATKTDLRGRGLKPAFAIPPDNPSYVVIGTARYIHFRSTGVGGYVPNFRITMFGGKYGIDDIATSSDGRFIVAGKDSGIGDRGIVEVWGVHSGREDHQSFQWIQTLEGVALAMNHDGNYYFRDSGSKVSERRSSDAKQTQTYTNNSGSHVTALAYERDYVASGHRNGDVVLWDYYNERFVRNLRGAQGEINHLSFTSDRQYLAAASTHGVYVWHVDTGELITKFGGSRSDYYSVAFSPNGTLAVTFPGGGGIRIYKRSAPTLSSLDISKRKLDSATLIDGLKIDKTRMYGFQGTEYKNCFIHNGDSHFVLLEQGKGMNTCGTASVEMILHYYGKQYAQNHIWKAGGIHTVVPGTWPWEAEQALDRLGVSSTHYKQLDLADLRRYVDENRPPMILLRFTGGIHYCVVVGYNRNSGDYLLADPNGFFRWMDGNTLKDGWSMDGNRVIKGHGVTDLAKYSKWILLNTAGALVPYNAIVPRSAPTYYNAPNYSQLRSSRVVGSDKLWAGMEDWSRSFTFDENFHHYHWSFRRTWHLNNIFKNARGWVDGASRNGKTVKIWGKKQGGKFHRVEMYLWVRTWRHSRNSQVAAAPSMNLAVQPSEVLPVETSLLPNYPNPFNPETWIPYTLAAPAEVGVDIYAVDGQRVRTLSLGHQPAGVYRNRARAAYWDGRNNAGERVASGVYFYTFTAGKFTATRKMLILK